MTTEGSDTLDLAEPVPLSYGASHTDSKLACHQYLSPSSHAKNMSTLTSIDLKALNSSLWNSKSLIGKSLHRNEIDENNKDSIDRIERYLSHLQSCCQNYSGFDIYQILAFRRFNSKSRQPKKHRPFKLLGSLWEITLGSSYFDALFTGIITGCLQIVGISVILAETVYVYFNGGEEEVLCEYQLANWTLNDTIFKILAGLFALMVSKKLSKLLRTQRHAGFNEILSSIDPEDFGKLYFVDIAMIQFGLLINVYTLFTAVVGSYFLIYASEDGSDSLSMVLDSIALFFMCEIDDLLVADSDYEDVEDFINEFYEQWIKNKESNIKQKDNIGIQSCGYRGLHICDRIVDVIQFLLITMTYVNGVIAPIAITVCW